MFKTSASNAGNEKRRRFKKPSLKTLLGICGAVSILPVLVLCFSYFGIILTYSGSVPIGFYKRTSNPAHIQRGDYLSFCLPNHIAAMGLERGYIHRGGCANGSEVLIKQVIAVPGDRITLTHQTLVINSPSSSIVYFAPRAITDKQHLPVHHFIKKGEYRATGYWVYGIGSPRLSWDSRYYGGIPKAAIRHRFVPLWLF